MPWGLTWRGGRGGGRPQDVFEVGDRVRCVVMGIEDDYDRISLSTAELEAARGDMLKDPVRRSAPSCTDAPFLLLKRSFDIGAGGIGMPPCWTSSRSHHRVWNVAAASATQSTSLSSGHRKCLDAAA